MESGRLVATFKRSPDGALRAWPAGKYIHYEIRLTVDDLPEGVKAVTYLLHPSSKSARVQSVPYGVQGFREDISAYGDFFITVTAEGFRPRSNEWFAIAFATKLSDALSVGHPPIARTKEVDEAIMELASHDPDSLLASQPSNQSDNTSKLQLRIFDGSRRLFSAPAQFLVTITDGNQTQQFRDFVSTNVTQFHLPFFDNFADNYTVVVWADGYKQVGFTPVTLTNQFPEALDLMLIPADPGFNFTDACWEAVRATYPFIGSDLDATTGARRYEALLDNSERTLACFLNLCEAMRQITLSQGTPLDYIKRLIWDTLTPKQDGFFAWCKPALIDQLKVGAEARQFAPVINPGVFRRGATSSWKEVVFGDVQVRFTFYENNRNAVDDVDCVMVEINIDYFKNLGAHVLFGVALNAITDAVIDPAVVYVLRWMAARQSKMPEFAPLYTITS